MGNNKGNNRKNYDNSYNPAKSYAGDRNRSRNTNSSRRRKEKQENSLSKKIGIVLTIIQAVITCLFSVSLIKLNLLPMKFVLPVIAALALLCLIPMLIQFKARKKAVVSKVFSVFMSVALAFGSFYMSKADGMVEKVSGGDYKLDRIVVAVAADDPAENLKDAASYTFGVQYNMGGEDIKEAVAGINKELQTEIATVEYKSVAEQATKLHDGEVKAIVYNEAYMGILEETFENYNENVKIIYSHNIKKKMANKEAKEVKVTDSTFSVFLSGIDVYGPIATNSRSDVNIIATVNTKTHQILLTTTPRDYYVPIPGVSGGSRDKLTHAGIYGVDTSIKTLEELYDMNIDFYARVNFTSLVEIINTLGGVEVESEYAFTTGTDSGLVVKVNKGKNTFNGKQALAFCRERHNLAGGDNQRGKNQQAVITGIIKKIISPTILLKANGIINSVSGNVETNMSEKQLQNLIKTQINKGGAWNITSVAAEGTRDRQSCFSSGSMPLYVTQPDQASVDNIKAMIDAVENGEMLDGAQTVE